MEGASQTILSNVAQLVGQEFLQLRRVRGEVAELRNELATMNTLLSMQSEANESALNQFVREWMNQVRELAYDAEDCVDLYIFRIRCRQGDGFLLWSKRLLATLFPRHRLAGDIAALRARAVSISERHARYGVSMELLRRTASSDRVQAAVAASARVLRPDNDPNQFVGITAQAILLADKVKEDKETGFKVHSIVGFGGLGKTTLAVEVCRQLETELQLQAKVSVSQTFSSKDLEELLRRVIRQIVPCLKSEKALQQADMVGKIDTMDVGELERMLRDSLEDNRYLVLIDDVWSTTAWDAIRSKLPNNRGGRIILTTRIDSVAKACSNANDYYIHRMKVLNNKESTQLFLSKAFGSMAKDSCPEDLKDAMKNILRKCGGLPLAIVSIASLLASYKPPEGKPMWEIVGRSIGSQMESNPTLEGMRQILTLSYDHLPQHLKACMMYLSIFPEDYVIWKDRLLKRWVAEGLVAEKRGMTQMELADGYFNELLSRNMIERATREETCRVHDMMLEVIVSKSLESNFVSLVGGQYEGMSYDTIRRLTIHGRDGVQASQDSSSKKMSSRRGMRDGFTEMTVQHVRSLSIFDPEAQKLLARLGEFTLLRVLDLEDCKGQTEKHMRQICRMYLLRFLSLKGTDVAVMPSSIGDLEHLQTLDVRETNLKCLPQTVTNLEKLEYLLFIARWNKWSGWMLPHGINKMKALRRMDRGVVIYDPKVVEEIGELDQLQELCIYVDTRQEKEVNPKVLEELASSLSKMYSLRWLDIGNFGCEKWPFNPILEFLHQVESPPRLLSYLRIWGCIDELPEWVESLTDLVEAEIAWAHVDCEQLFNVLCKLPNLKRLLLGPYFCWDQEMVASSSQSFPELKEFTIGYAPEKPREYIFEEGCMPKLETLVLNFGDQGNKRIVGIEHLTNLKEVQLNALQEAGAWDVLLEVVNVENEKRLVLGSEQIRVTASRLRWNDQSTRSMLSRSLH